MQIEAIQERGNVMSINRRLMLSASWLRTYLILPTATALLIQAGCGLLDEEDRPTEAHVRLDGIAYTLRLPSSFFDRQGSLDGTFEVENLSGSSFHATFSNMQQVGWELKDRRGRVCTSWPIVVSPALSALILEVGDRKVYSLSGSFADQQGNPIPPGSYRLEVFLLRKRTPRLALDVALE